MAVIDKDVRAGQFCTIGDTGHTSSGTPMACYPVDGGGSRGRMKLAAGATPASKQRAGTPRTRRTGQGLEKRAVDQLTLAPSDKLPPKLVDQLDVKQLGALRTAGGLTWTGKKARKTDLDKLKRAGLLTDEGKLTSRGAEVLRQSGQLGEDSCDDDEREAFERHGERPAPKPIVKGQPVDRSADAGTDWSNFDACPDCAAAAAAACCDLRSPGSLNAVPHPNRPAITLTTTRPAPNPAPSATVPARSNTELPLDKRIEAAYDDLKKSPAGYVMLSDLRRVLPDVDPAAFDQAVKQMDRAEATWVVPESNQKVLSQEQRAGAVVMGNQEKHLFAQPGCTRPATGALKPAPGRQYADDRSGDAGTDWSKYRSCGTCGTGPGEACLDLRGDGSYNATPHPNRETVPTSAQAPAPAAETPRERVADEVKKVIGELGNDPAYDKVGPHEHHWVNLSRIREGLSGRYSRKQVDQALRDLHDQNVIDLEPEANQKTLRQVDRDGALHRGGEDRHLAAIIPPPAPRRPEDRGDRPTEDRSGDAGTDWSLYDDCGDCGASTGQACRDLGRPGSYNATPHPGRTLLANRGSTGGATQQNPAEPRPVQAPSEDDGRPEASPAGEPMPTVDEARQAIADMAGMSASTRRAMLRSMAHGNAQAGNDEVAKIYQDALKQAEGEADQDLATRLTQMSDEVSAPARTPTPDEQRIRDAYEQVTAELDSPNEWISLADLRDKVPDMSKSDFDQAVRTGLARAPDALVEEETNQKALRQRDRASAVVIGDRAQHIVKIDPELARPTAPRVVREPAPFDNRQAAVVASRVESAPDRAAARQHLDNLTPAERAQVGNLVGLGGEPSSDAVIDRLAPRLTEDRSADAGTDWTIYGGCGTCGAGSGRACTDLGSPGSFNAHPHPGRPLVADPYEEARRRDIAADQRRADALAQAAADDGMTSHEPGSACPLGLWHTGPCPPRESEKPLQDRVADAYDDLANRPGGTVRLSDLRDRFPDVPRDQLDEALLDMDDNRRIQLEPDPDRGGLTDRDRVSALPMVGRDTHLLRKTNQEMEQVGIDARTPIDPTRLNTAPESRNHWGGFARPGDAGAGVSYHQDGPFGIAMARMRPDVAQIDVDGLPLRERLNRRASDVVVGTRHSQDLVDEMKEIRDRLPDGPARRTMDSVIDEVDGPPIPMPALPANTPAPLRDLVEDLHRIPLCRRHPEKELDRAVALAEQVAAGQTKVESLTLLARPIMQITNATHESSSAEGKFDILRALKKLDAEATRRRRA